MRIVVNAALLPDVYSDEYITCLSDTFKHITEAHPEHHVIFICEKQDAGFFNFGNSTEVIITRSRKKSALLWKYWYDVRIPSFLRKYKADLFFSPGVLCSLRTKVPQVLLINGISFLTISSEFIKLPSIFFKKRMMASIANAKRIITNTNYTKEKIISDYNVSNKKIDVVSINADSKYMPQPDSIKEAIKNKYTNGKEFFLYTGAVHSAANLIYLLKAFSLFKKRQQSNLKLVIYGNDIEDNSSFIQQIGTYKYKADIKLIGNLMAEEHSMLISSAYALVYPVLANSFLIPVIQAMQSNTPVIVSSDKAIEEITGGAAIYVNPENPQDIADGMMRIYKDERLRNELINKGKIIADRHPAGMAGKQLWEAIQTTLS